MLTANLDSSFVSLLNIEAGGNKNNNNKKITSALTEDLLSAENRTRYLSGIKMQIVNTPCP